MSKPMKGQSEFVPWTGPLLDCLRALGDSARPKVTQRSCDGGVDGHELLRLSPFVSLRVAFQTKRCKDVVTRIAAGEFRNAPFGRAEKGVFITTGHFTPTPRAKPPATALCWSS